MDVEKTLEHTLKEYLGRTTKEAAEAGKLIANYVLNLEKATWKTNKATIDFRAERQFCSIWPVKSHVTFWITKTDKMTDVENRLNGKGRTANLKIYSKNDVDDYLKNLIKQSYRFEGMRPLKRKARPNDN